MCDCPASLCFRVGGLSQTCQHPPANKRGHRLPVTQRRGEKTVTRFFFLSICRTIATVFLPEEQRSVLVLFKEQRWKVFLSEPPLLKSFFRKTSACWSLSVGRSLLNSFCIKKNYSVFLSKEQCWEVFLTEEQISVWGPFLKSFCLKNSAQVFVIILLKYFGQENQTSKKSFCLKNSLKSSATVFLSEQQC